MKYILWTLIIILISGCTNQKNSHDNTLQTNNTKENGIYEEKNNKKTKAKNNNITIIKQNDFNLTFKDNKLIYPPKKMVLLFYNDGFYSKEEEKILKKLNIKYHKTNNEFLKKYFEINYFPTIIVLEQNKTVKFENFTPYEILKTEGF